jgi:hypothetical protein
LKILDIRIDFVGTQNWRKENLKTRSRMREAGREEKALFNIGAGEAEVFEIMFPALFFIIPSCVRVDEA